MPSPARVSPRRYLLSLCQKALFHSHADQIWRRLTHRRGAIILMYHSVPGLEASRWIDPTNATAPKVFEEQMRFLSEHRQVVSLDSLVETLESGRTLDPGSVVLTFDDGYLDNYTVAAPILAELGLPATFFLASGYIACGRPQWIDELYSLYRARSGQTLDLRASAGGSFDLTDQRDVDASYTLLSERLLESDMTERSRLFAELAQQLRPVASPPRLTLGWPEVRDLAALYPGFRIGVHTRDHLALPTRTPERIERELELCIADVRRGVGVEPSFFSFPYGRSCEVSRHQVEARFRAAVVTDPPRLVDGSTDRFALPRVAPPDDPTLFQSCTSGAYPDLLHLLLGRA